MSEFQNVLVITMLSLAVLLSAILLMLLVQSQNNRSNLTLSLLEFQVVENQRLRNQLLSKDLPSLHGLNAATLPEGPAPSNSEYFPQFDEGATFQQDLDKSDYSVVGAPDDLNAAGWDPVIQRDPAQYGPVKFDE